AKPSSVYSRELEGLRCGSPSAATTCVTVMPARTGPTALFGWISNVEFVSDVPLALSDDFSRHPKPPVSSNPRMINLVVTHPAFIFLNILKFLNLSRYGMCLY